jgi:diguanylate cyclase (GGDEF)-like protein
MRDDGVVETHGEEHETTRTQHREMVADEETLRASLDVFLHLDLNDQLQEILQQTLDWTAAKIGFAFAWDEERRVLTLVRCTLPEDDPRRQTLQRLDPSKAASWDITEATRFDGLGPLATIGEPWPVSAPASTLVLPLRTSAEEPAGLVIAMDLGSAVPDRLQKLAVLARPALANALQVRAIRDLVIKDDTAECYNRRYFEDFLPEELARASRFRSPLSLIFFDMDNLKEVNTRFGHAMGSRTLREVSQRVRARVRKFDKLFRFGGDEFCIVLPETEWHGALEVAERVRETIAGRNFLQRERGEQGGIRMTASFGIASFPLHARTKEELVQQADRAMQRIKSGTKNSIAISESAREDDGA